MYIGSGSGPIALPSNLFSCNSASCQADFSVGDSCEFAVANEFTAVELAPVSTPEPTAWIMLAMGILAALVMDRVKARKTTTSL